MRAQFLAILNKPEQSSAPARDFRRVAARCDQYGGVTLYHGTKRISLRGLTAQGAVDELTEMGFRAEVSDIPQSEGVRQTFVR